MYIIPIYFYIILHWNVFAYTMTPKPKIIIKYPTPQNAEK